MIIKIMKPNRIDFWMCDNVESIHVEQVRKLNMESLTVNDVSTKKVACSIYESDDPQTQRPITEYRSWAIDFKLRADDERYVALFNTIAYICNDNGQTVERVCG